MGLASDLQTFMGHKLLVNYYKSLKRTIKSRLNLSDFLNLVLTLKTLNKKRDLRLDPLPKQANTPKLNQGKLN